MALEDRVKALEEELAVLKDQIRNTLLEIQEQVLMHYYPDLRANDPVPVGVAMPAQASGGSGNGHGNGNGNGHGNGDGSGKRNGSHGAARRFGLEELHPEEGASQTTVGSAHSLPSGNSNAPGNGSSGRHRRTDMAAREDDRWTMVARLMVWARDAVETIGSERTAKAVEIAAKTGSLNADVRDSLLQLIAMGQSDAAVERVSMGTIVDTFLSLSQVLGCEDNAASLQRLMEEVKGG